MMWQLFTSCFGASANLPAEPVPASASAKSHADKGSRVHSEAAAVSSQADAIVAITTQGSGLKRPKSVKWASSDDDEQEAVSLPNSSDGIEAHAAPHSSADGSSDSSVLADAGEHSTHSRSLAAHRNTSARSSSGSDASVRRRSSLSRQDGDSAAQQRQQQQSQQNAPVPPTGVLDGESSGYLDACNANMEESMRELQRVVSDTSEAARSFKSRRSSMESLRASFAGSRGSTGGGSIRTSNSGASIKTSASGASQPRGSTGGFMQEPTQQLMVQDAAGVGGKGVPSQQGTAVMPFTED